MEFLSLVSFCGFIAVALFLYKAALVLHAIFFPFFIAQPKNLKKLAGARWAGEFEAREWMAYAFELAARGFDLLLISRTQSKLDQTAEEIRQKSQVEIKKTIAFDFSKADFDEYEQKLLSVLKSMEVGVLGELALFLQSIVCSVNNVGMSYEYPERLDLLEGGLKRVSDITVMNTLPVTLLSATVLSQMAQRNAGVVVNLSSSAAYHPMYYWAIYSATKAYFFGGLVNHGLALAIHDISHNTAYGNKRPISNRLFGMFANLPIGVPISVSFKKHVHHVFSLTVDCLQLIYDLLILYICGPRSLVYLIGGTLMAMGAHPSSGHFIAEHYAFNHDQETYSYYGPWNLVLYNVSKLAPEFYDQLYKHDSWSRVLWHFIWSPCMGPFQRLKRKPTVNQTPSYHNPILRSVHSKLSFWMDEYVMSKLL
ncbi:Sphingolipid 4-desaturase [Aphelenchoides besseyi]|nr:Sphingolipid 4-desaturase [Aphelenchoides besseyi]